MESLISTEKKRIERTIFDEKVSRREYHPPSSHPYRGDVRNRAGSMAVHVVRVYHDHSVKRESNPRPGAMTSKTAASLRPRCNSAILAPTHTNTSKRIIDAYPVSKSLPLFFYQFYLPTASPEAFCNFTEIFQRYF